MAVEADGTIVVAAIGGGLCVVQADGSGHEYVEVPGDRFVTNICFGGDDLKTAFITGSGVGKLFSCEWPRPGLKLSS
jgi:gluconolactonase